MAVSVWRDNMFKQLDDVRSENELLRQECEVLRDQSRLVDSLQRQVEIEVRGKVFIGFSLVLDFILF